MTTVTDNTIKPDTVAMAAKPAGLSDQTTKYLAAAVGAMCAACGAGALISPSTAVAATGLAAAIAAVPNTISNAMGAKR